MENTSSMKLAQGELPPRAEVARLLGKDADDAWMAVEDLVQLKKGILQLPAAELAAISLRCLTNGLALAPSLISSTVINASTLVFLNLRGDSQSQAIFGIYDSFLGLSYQIVANMLLERGCILMSRALGQSDHLKIREVFSKCCLTYLLVFAAYILPLVLLAGDCLRLIGFQPDIAAQVHAYLR